MEMMKSKASLSPLIGGSTVSSRAGEAVDVIDPSVGTKLFSMSVGATEDVDAAVAAARLAHNSGSWSKQPASAKKKIMHCWAELVAQEASSLDMLDAEEMGKPVSLGFANAAHAASLIRYYAEAVDKVKGDVYESDYSSLVVEQRVPRGVVGAIVPWNFPTANAALKVAPALAAGNSVILKPSELSSRSAIRLAELALEAGLPPGVLNVVPGLGATVGKAMGLHPDIDMISFTGSTATGKRFLEYSGQSNMKVIMAECGGKSPQIVFRDAPDLELVGRAIAQLLLLNQGQLCSVGSRLLVERSIEEDLVAIINDAIKNIDPGRATDTSTEYGPLASEGQLNRVMGYIDAANEGGAQLVAGGNRIRLPDGGFYVEPTLFRNVDPKSRLAQEEIFGPVLAITAFDDEAEAIHLANDTVYGLVAYVWTRDIARGMRVAKGIRSSVLVNAAVPQGEGPGHAFSAEPYGQSGMGVESGIAGMESYMRRHLIWFNHD